MKVLILLKQTLVLGIFGAIPFAHTAVPKPVVMSPPKLIIESAQLNATLEKRGETWRMTSQQKPSEKIETKAFSTSSESLRVDAEYDNIRNWVLATAPMLKVQPKCQDVAVHVIGAFSRHILLCSKIQAHRVFASSFYDKILAVSR